MPMAVRCCGSLYSEESAERLDNDLFSSSRDEPRLGPLVDTNENKTSLDLLLYDYYGWMYTCILGTRLTKTSWHYRRGSRPCDLAWLFKSALIGLSNKQDDFTYLYIPGYQNCIGLLGVMETYTTLLVSPITTFFSGHALCDIYNNQSWAFYLSVENSFSRYFSPSYRYTPLMFLLVVGTGCSSDL